MPRFDTGAPRQDAQDDFTRLRRRRAFERLISRLRREPDDVDVVLPYEEVLQALGYVGQREIGVEVVPLDSIVGSVDRTAEFDRHFHPTTERTRARWERIALAARRGASFPPVSLYRIGEVHFVRDGHHRISVARAHGLEEIEADITEILTKVGAEREIRLADLPTKGQLRLFHERVPLELEARRKIQIRDSWDYAMLAEGIEAWGFRAMQERRELLSREEVARLWFDDEYEPVVAMLREYDLIGELTETEAYMRIVTERYRLLRTHAWSPEIWDRLTRELGED